MKFFKLITLAMVSSFFIVGCGTQNHVEENPSAVACANTLIPIEVDFSWEPTEINSGDNITFTALVTHDDITVSEANEVKFEIWEHSNPEYHFMEVAKNAGDGYYSLDWTFHTDGVYYVYYHVTACDMHRMEKDMVVVGDVDVDTIIAEPDTVSGKMEHGHHKDGEEHHDHDESEEEHSHEHHEKENNKHQH